MSPEPSTGVYFGLAIGIAGLLVICGGIAVHIQARRQRALANSRAPTRPTSQPSRAVRDPVVRAEAGESTEGLPKYSAAAGADEQTVDRNTSRRPNWMALPTVLRQATLPAQPPPSYDPSTPRASS